MGERTEKHGQFPSAAVNVIKAHFWQGKNQSPHEKGLRSLRCGQQYATAQHYTAEHGLLKDMGSATLWMEGERKMGKEKKP